MSRGHFMQLRKQGRTDFESTFAVFASGWDIGTDELVEVGKLIVNSQLETATFLPSGPWLQDAVVEPFERSSLHTFDTQGLWMRWLIELGKKSLVQSEHLSKFI